MNSETLYLKTIINKLDLLKKAVLFTEMFEEKRFVAACIQINRKIIDPLNAKEHYESSLRKKTKITKTVKRKYSANKNF